MNRKVLNPITSWCIDIEMFRLIPELKRKKYTTILKWIFLSLKRNNYTFRIYMHLAQDFPDNTYELIASFVSSCYKSRVLNMPPKNNSY